MRKDVVCFAADAPKDSRIEQDILSDVGALLVPKGTLVSDRVLGLLKNYMGSIHISIETEFVDIELDETEDKKTVHISEEMKTDTLNRLEKVYENLEDTGMIVEETSTITEALIGTLNQSDATLVSIEQLKISDEYTFKHCVDVAVLSMILAKHSGKPDDNIKDITQAGLLHDIGKSRIPKEILNKPAALDEKEWEMMRKHPTWGYQMVKDNPDLSEDVKIAILEHHENVDGTGYPLGAKGDQIHYMSKILTIADVYDALITERAYKEAKNPAEALEIMYAMANKFDIDLFRAFLDCIVLYPVGSTVKLSNGCLCAVIKNHQYYPLRPLCQDLVSGEKYDLLNDKECRNLVIV